MAAKSLTKRMSSGGAHGWNIDIDAGRRFFHSVRCFGSWNGGGCGCRHDARCWVLRDRNASWSAVGLEGSELNLWTFSCSHHLGMEEGYRPYFENYTVDASILNLAAFGLFELQRLSRRNGSPAFGCG